MIPKYMTIKLMSCFKNESRCFIWPDFFNTSNEVNSWLNKRLVITADCSEQQIGPFTFRFNWTCEKWVIK